MKSPEVSPGDSLRGLYSAGVEMLVNCERQNTLSYLQLIPLD